MLRGKNIILRTFRNEADFEMLMDESYDVLKAGFFWPANFPTRVNWDKNFKEDGWWGKEKGWLLITDLDGVAVGTIGFFTPSSIFPEDIEIGGRIFDPDKRSTGIMTEAAKILVAYLFDLRPYQRIQASCLVGNVATKTLVTQLGFTYEGAMRNKLFHRNKYRDLEIYSVLRGEFPSLAEVMDELGMDIPKDPTV